MVVQHRVIWSQNGECPANYDLAPLFSLPCPYLWNPVTEYICPSRVSLCIRPRLSFVDLSRNWKAERKQLRAACDMGKENVIGIWTLQLECPWACPRCLATQGRVGAEEGYDYDSPSACGRGTPFCPRQHPSLDWRTLARRIQHIL